MNKKDFAKIKSLYTSGVDSHTCTVAILQMVCGYENSSVAFRTAAEDIDKFYREVIFNSSIEKAKGLEDRGIGIYED